MSARPSTASLIAAGLLDFARVNEGTRVREDTKRQHARRTRRGLRARWSRTR